jgi:hypothetical protein
MRSTHLWAKGRWVPRLGYRFYGHLPMFSAQLSSRGSQPSNFSAAADQCTSATIAARISAQATTPCHRLSLCFMLEFLASDALRHIIGHTRFGTCPVLRLAVRATGPGGSSFGLSPVSPMILCCASGSHDQTRITAEFANISHQTCCKQSSTRRCRRSQR